MKKIIVFMITVAVLSCQAFSQQPKENNQVASRIYNISYDSVLKRLIDFTSTSAVPMKIVAVTPGIILIEETFNDEQAHKYTDIEIQEDNSNIQMCQERLILNIKSDPTQTTVYLKSIITCSISYNKHFGKEVEIENKTIELNSNGVREKEILDYLSNNNKFSDK